MVRIAMVWFCCALVVCTPMWAQAGEGARFTLTVIRGDDAQNNIKKGRATKAVVEVRDRNNKPVAGIAVLFLLPDSGPSGAFVSGAQTASVSTDSAGQASITFKPNNVSGQYNMKVTVKQDGQESSVNIKQTNVSGGGGGGLSTTAIVVISLAAVALGVGLGVGLNQGGNSHASTVVLTPGGTVVGPPK